MNTKNSSAHKGCSIHLNKEDMFAHKCFQKSSAIPSVDTILLLLSPSLRTGLLLQQEQNTNIINVNEASTQMHPVCTRASMHFDSACPEQDYDLTKVKLSQFPLILFGHTFNSFSWKNKEDFKVLKFNPNSRLGGTPSTLKQLKIDLRDPNSVANVFYCA